MKIQLMEETKSQIERDFGLNWCMRRLKRTLEMESHPDLTRKKNVLKLENERMRKEKRPKAR